MPKLAQTPGTVLKSLLDEYQLSTAKLAQAIGLSNSAVYQIAIGKTRVSAPVALRLAKYFGQTPAYWLELQTKTDLAEAAGDKKLSSDIKAISKAKKPKAPKVVKASKPAKGAGAKKAPAKKAAGKATVRKVSAKKAVRKAEKAPAPRKPAVILIKKSAPTSEITN
ncbi:putative addiction module antidote protein, HigA family [Treponema primitia ZAS-2]|uniref:Putative addiction module antidote protein, HigA family n=1 Tax=Treponema primitia (strain ATCC BAA-887 / DSM 12427 / ZAS-2) TaxID=545694 RepID=F5YPS7_TREPZ|nr:HigA family addiction module antitoxin [Treponema primitia]AEF86201.1 putative addiction module antidote protein, HigA family [Treponema primitia ZAS-2]